MPAELASWSIDAVNLAEHADNPVHTEEGGRAAGYRGAVVAGTTVYAYLTRVAAAGWGLAWVQRGGAEVRFRAAVIAGDHLDVVPVDDGDRCAVEARVGEELKARCVLEQSAAPPPPPAGDRLEPLVEVLDDRWAGYGARVGDDLGLYEAERVVHPAAWPCLANRVFATQLVDGPWVHTRSRIVHLGRAEPGTTALIEAFLVDRFHTRAGERALVDVRIGVDGRPVAAVEHEAIVRLAVAHRPSA